MSLLTGYRDRRIAEIREISENTVAAYRHRILPNRDAYFLRAFSYRVFAAVSTLEWIESVDDLDVSWIDRERFHADIAVKIPTLLQKLGAKEYAQTIAPRLIGMIQSLVWDESGIQRVEAAGMYVNILLDDRYVFGSLRTILDLGDAYGYGDRDRETTAIVEYSDPNTAKHLHAGHIRSTIIGHIIGNLMERTGHIIHRINHYNDWGGIGAIMEGFSRWSDEFAKTHAGNSLLYEIYLRYRTGEKLSSKEALWDEADEQAQRKLCEAYGSAKVSYSAFQEAFADFKRISHERFLRLENHDDDEFRLWERLIPMSLAEFSEFYDLLWISIEHPMGESMYADIGRDIVDAGVTHGTAVFYTREHADEDLKKLRQRRDKQAIEEEQYDTIREGIERDIGSYIVRIGEFERTVMMKEDRSTIYMTRDIGVVKFRLDMWHPSILIYEVGQEQADHFDGIFRSARVLGILPDDDSVSCEHIYHGYYVNESGAKLSSRDGASNILSLIRSAIDFFHAKYDDSGEFDDEEKDRIAHALAVGSIIFNDIRKDRKQPVVLGSNLQTILEAFEASGGAYIVYASCRAKNILAKAEKLGVEATSLPQQSALESDEIALIKKLHEYPRVIERATDGRNPSTLAEYMITLAQTYNSYYAKCPVIPDFPYRLTITRAVAQVLDNALRTCHMIPLERI